MKLIKIDGQKLKNIIIAGANRLNKNKGEINSLNVFPVPDGDTGTNMSLTVLSAAQEVIKVNTNNISDVAKAISTGSLKGARGNSGVILSQLFRGFYKALEGKIDANAKDIANALNKGTEMAYKAVMKPKEGTILTVAKAIGDKAIETANITDDIVKMMKETIKYANTVLDKTVDMLPELKQAGVVDAGGKGLLYIIMGGMYDRATDTEQYQDEALQPINTVMETNVDIKYGYCTEFFINLNNTDEKVENIKKFLASIGNSIVLASDDDFIKIHVHTNNPGKVLDKAIQLGSLDNIKIENMRTQHTNSINFGVQKPQKEFGFVAISTGEGINEFFMEFGVDQVIEGGQTMNPSIEDILIAVERVNAKNVFVLPNNKNIILGAKQASEVYTDKNIIVIETTNIVQGFAVLTAFINTDTLQNNIDNMNKSMHQICTGHVTYAVRETKINDIEIKENDILCILNGKINNVSKDTYSGTKELIQAMLDKINTNTNKASIISIYYGDDYENEALLLEQYLTEKYSELDIEVMYGGQALYYYIISIE